MIDDHVILYFKQTIMGSTCWELQSLADKQENRILQSISLTGLRDTSYYIIYSLSFP